MAVGGHAVAFVADLPMFYEGLPPVDVGRRALELPFPQRALDLVLAGRSGARRLALGRRVASNSWWPGAASSPGALAPPR
eukprot:1869049-Lingulodinium_polyedra.AAC.1